MNFERVYNAWKAQKRKIDSDRAFTDAVMCEVRKYELQKRSSRRFLHLLAQRISSHALGKAALLAICALLGILRMVTIFAAILS
jgi:hypothetical protein